MTGLATKNWLRIAVVIAFATGLFGRLSGFGQRPLAIDEYFFVKSIELILDNGVPYFPDGGYYMQGLAPQYLTALFVLIFGKSEAVFRLPALFFGLLAPCLAYRYARIHLCRTMSLAVAAALLLSSWEIEFSRFARMYTAFQCAALAFLIQMDRSVLDLKWHRRYRAHFWAVVATLCHFEGALLAPLLYTPLLDWYNRDRFPDRRSRLEYFAVTSLVVASAGWFASFDFRRWRTFDLYPAGYTPPVFHFIRTPSFPLWSIFDDARWNLAFVLAVLTCVVLLWLFLADRKTFPQLVTPLVAVAAAFHQGMLAALLTGLLLLRAGWSNLLRRHRVILAVSAGVLGGWAAIALVRGVSRGGLYQAFLGWPNLIEPFWQSWLQDLPLLGLLTLAAVMVVLVKKAKAEWIDFARGPAAVIAYWIICLGLIRYYYETTRYTFVLYPVALAALGQAIALIASPRWAAAIFLGLFCFSGDFDPVHIAQSGTDEVAFRFERYTHRAALWYPRQDYRGVAQWLATSGRRGPSEAIVIEGCAPVSYYLAVDHGIFLHRSLFGFYERSRKNGSVELWSRRRLLGTSEELRAYTRDNSAVWLVRGTQLGGSLLDPNAVWGGRLESVTREFLGPDGIEVLLVSLRKKDSPQ